jgi:GMP synthase-like glutamine amidotransferase
MLTLCRTTAGSVLYSYGEANAREDVWMSHGDSVVQLPPGFSVVAKSDQVLHGASCNSV